MALLSGILTQSPQCWESRRHTLYDFTHSASLLLSQPLLPTVKGPTSAVPLRILGKRSPICSPAHCSHRPNHVLLCTCPLMGFIRIAVRNRGCSKSMGDLSVATPLKKTSLTPLATTDLPVNHQECAELGEPLPSPGPMGDRSNLSLVLCM